MVNQLVILVDLENERVVDVVASEYLDRKTSGEHDEANDGCEVIGVHTGINLLPFRMT